MFYTVGCPTSSYYLDFPNNENGQCQKMEGGFKI